MAVNRLACLVCFAVLGVTMTSSYQFTGVPDSQVQSLLNPSPSGPWVGGDIATSIGVAPGQYVWLYGDTLTGSIENGTRQWNISSMPRNSIGMMTGTKSQQKYFVRPITENTNAFFTPQNKTDWLWPTSGVAVKGRIFAFATQMYESGDGGPFGFAFRGTAVLDVSPVSQDPYRWTYGISMLPRTDDSLNWASSAYINPQDSKLYVLGTFHQACAIPPIAVLSRFQVSDVFGHQWAAQEVLTSTGWNLLSSTNLAYLKPLEFPGISETSIFRVPVLNQFGILHMPFASTQVFLWTSDQLEGPWVNQGSIYDIPAPYNDTSRVFCYAPKVHPQFSSDSKSFLFTFMSNTFKTEDLTLLPMVYIAQAVRVTVN